MIVDLPEPDGPTNAHVEDAGTRRHSPSKTRASRRAG